MAATNAQIIEADRFDFLGNFPPDTELVCDDQTKVQAHRLPLTTASRYFRAACFGFGGTRTRDNVRK